MSSKVPSESPNGSFEGRVGDTLLKKTRMCRFYGSGCCSRGESCSFAHGESELRVQPDLMKTKMCKFYTTTGECRVSSCRYAHGRHELRKLRSNHDDFKYEAYAAKVCVDGMRDDEWSALKYLQHDSSSRTFFPTRITFSL